MARRVSRPQAQAEAAAVLARPEPAASNTSTLVRDRSYDAASIRHDAARLRDTATQAMAMMEEGAYRAASRPGDPEARRLLERAEHQLDTVRRRLATLEGMAEAEREQHRRQRPARRAVNDAEGYDLRPDPLEAHNAAELVDALRRYRIWAGEPSFREMAANSRQRAAASTLCAALSSEALPTMDVVAAVVIGCGGSDKDLQAFTTARRLIRFGDSASARPDLRVLPRAARVS